LSTLLPVFAVRLLKDDGAHAPGFFAQVRARYVSILDATITRQSLIILVGVALATAAASRTGRR